MLHIRTKNVAAAAVVTGLALAPMPTALGFAVGAAMMPTAAYADGEPFTVGGAGYATFAEAIVAVEDGGTITLASDVDLTAASNYASNRIAIGKSVTVDLGGHVMTVANRGFGVGVGASAPIDVTFKNGSIVNNAKGGRCIDTRGNISSLTLDGMTIDASASSTNSQPITIGGNQADNAKINISGSTIKAGNSGYCIISFNPFDAKITDTTFEGWSAFYFKGPDSSAGSAGTTVAIDGGKIVSDNVHSGVSNAFAAIVFEDSKITVDITGTDISIGATGDQPQFISSNTSETADTVVRLGKGNHVDLNGDNAKWANGDSAGEPLIEVSAGSFSERVPDDYAADGFFPTDAVIDGSRYTVARPIDGATVNVDPQSVTYDGSEKKPAVKVTLADGTVLSDGDFTVIYANNVEVGEATVTVTGVAGIDGGYMGTATGKFTITPAQTQAETPANPATPAAPAAAANGGKGDLMQTGGVDMTATIAGIAAASAGSSAAFFWRKQRK